METPGGYGDFGRYGPSTPMKRKEDDITSYIATYDLLALMDKNW